MENDWIDVSYFLYMGISDRIDYYANKNVPNNKLKEIEKAVAIYNRRCVISGQFLTEALNKLKEQQV